ncbi:MAG TPA: hypothetical protein EYP86_01540 [Candidatus Altiarchaeales archaeon]|nr:hypothetical protein [Candidatus Altiarchaeales archaeon]
MKINHYEFGRIEINGNIYRNDVIIFPDHIKDNWWRREGHKLSIEDLKDMLKEKPEVLIIGTGASGIMKVPKETLGLIRSEGIEPIVKRTNEACRIYNSIAQGKKVIAALHLTC